MWNATILPRKCSGDIYISATMNPTGFVLERKMEAFFIFLVLRNFMGSQSRSQSHGTVSNISVTIRLKYDQRRPRSQRGLYCVKVVEWKFNRKGYFLLPIDDIVAKPVELKMPPMLVRPVPLLVY